MSGHNSETGGRCLMKVSPFLRQESQSAAEAGVCFGTSGESWQGGLGVRNSFTRAVNNRVEARSASAGQSSRDVPRDDIAFHTYRRTLSPKNQLDPFVDVMH